MGISFLCTCGARLHAREKFIGKSYLCPYCRRKNKVPHDTQGAPSAEEPQTNIDEAFEEAEPPGELQPVPVHEGPSPKPKLQTLRVGLLVGAVAVVAFACGWATGHFRLFSGGPDSGDASNRDGSGNSRTGATITADPNPVPAGSGRGTTTISWDTGDGSKGQVYFSINNGPEKRWFSNRASGSQEVSWIDKGRVYAFRLYADSERSKLLASVKVTTK
jgi:hypothetical protein